MFTTESPIPWTEVDIQSIGVEWMNLVFWTIYISCNGKVKDWSCQVIHPSHTVRSFWLLSKPLITPHDCHLISAHYMPICMQLFSIGLTTLYFASLLLQCFPSWDLDFFFHPWTNSDLPCHIYTTYCCSICYISFYSDFFSLQQPCNSTLRCIPTRNVCVTKSHAL